MQSGKSGCGRVVAVVGLIGSLVAIFAFVTGLADIPAIVDFLSKRNSQPDGTVSVEPALSVPVRSSSEPGASRMVPVNTPPQNPLPRLTSTPGSTSAPQPIDFDNPSVSITVYDSSDDLGDGNNVRIQFLAGKLPLSKVSVGPIRVTKDIAGHWTQDTAKHGEPIYQSDASGISEMSLEPGTWGFLNADVSAGWNQLMGSWGIQGVLLDGDKAEMVVFPVFPGKRTEILVSLARLGIGLLSPEGDVVKDASVQWYCQGTDIAGKKIESDRCPTDPVEMNICYDDPTGIATCTLGAGTYIIEVSRTSSDVIYFYDVDVQPGEVRREVFTIP